MDIKLKKNVTVYILAGGLGTRLSHVVKDVPKPMAMIDNKPFLEWQLMWLSKNGFKNVVILVGYKKEIIIEYFGDGSRWNLSIQYSIEEELLGTGGAVLNAMHHYPSECFIILNGDSFFNIDLDWFYNYCIETNCFSIALKYMKDTSRYGYVTIDDAYQVKNFFEKNPSLGDGYINGGIYIGRSDIFKQYDVKKCSMENDIFPQLLKTSGISGIPFGDRFIDIGVPDDYYTAQLNLSKWYYSEKKKVLFLDRDGIMIEDTGYVSTTDDVFFIEKTIDIVKEVNKHDISVIVITNQAGIAKGYYSIKEMISVNDYIKQHYKNNNAIISDFYYCPFHENGIVRELNKASLLRKPEPGMILLAAEEHNIDIMRSVMIGDKDSDIIKLPYLKSFLLQGNYEIKNKDRIINARNIISLLIEKGES